MNPSATALPRVSLLFNWEAPRRRKLAIAGFLAASTLAHAACFYLFQIVYPPTVSLLPPPARVSLISPASEEGRSLLRWIEAEDPALVSTTFRSPEAKGYDLPKVQHVPSYSGYEPAFKQAPPPAVDLRIPSTQPPGAVPIVRSRGAVATSAARTAVLFSPELQSVGSPALPPIGFTASNNEPPDQVRFQVGISSRGDARYCFGLNSSGDRALDEQARKYLMLCRFPGRSTMQNKTGEALVWGTATIEWGTDVARAPATSTATTTP